MYLILLHTLNTPYAATYSQNFTGSTLQVPSTAGPTTGPTPLSTSFSKPPLVSYPPTAKATATGILAQRERKPVLQATMTSREVATSLASSTQQEDQLQDADSLSSLPLSVPEETGYVHGIDINMLSHVDKYHFNYSHAHL